MKAAVLIQGQVQIQDLPIPSPQADEVVIKVHASCLNRADLGIVAGKAHGAQGPSADQGTRLGLECAGTVSALGQSVTRFKLGDRVMCTAAGAFAEYVSVNQHRVTHLPDEAFSFDEAACLPVATRTSYAALAMLGNLQPGQAVLVLGATSAVGMMCLQVARVLGAGTIIGTSTHLSSRERLVALGATDVVCSQDEDWVAQVQGITQGRGVDLVIDFLAGPFINGTMQATCLNGTIVNVGRMAGEQGEFDFDLHSLRRIVYKGMTFRTRSNEDIGHIAAQAQQALWPALARKEMGLPIAQRFALTELPDALACMRANQHVGKIVIQP